MTVKGGVYIQVSMTSAVGRGVSLLHSGVVSESLISLTLCNDHLSGVLTEK